MTNEKSTRKLICLSLVTLFLFTCVMTAAGATTISNDENNLVPRYNHYIPPEYFANATPATPLPESEMIMFVLSEANLPQTMSRSPSGIVNIPVSQLNLGGEFLISPHSATLLTDSSSIGPDDSVMLVRMPRDMYNRFVSESQNGVLSLPELYFTRHYENLTDLYAHINQSEDGLQILPSTADLQLLEQKKSIPQDLLTSNSANVEVINSVISSSDPFEKRHHFDRLLQNQFTNYDYCIGTITPYSVTFSGSNTDLYYSPQEREYYLNGGQDAIEIVVNYDHSGYTGGHISFFPAIYDNWGDIVDINTWESSGANIIYIPLSSLPHTYGYHVQISNGKYHITFEDMDTLEWFDAYIYNDQDNPSTTFSELVVSSEHIQKTTNVPSGFSALTSPIKEEWTRKYDDGVWFKPQQVWKYLKTTQNQYGASVNDVDYVDAYWSWVDSNLITSTTVGFTS